MCISQQHPTYQPLDPYHLGMLMPGRSYSSDKYRFGFNGKENDNEVKGTGNSQDYGFRTYDPRIIRFNSVDPIAGKFPMLTPFQFASNNPIRMIDLDGLEGTARLMNAEAAADGYKPVLKNNIPPKVQRALTGTWNIVGGTATAASGVAIGAMSEGVGYFLGGSTLVAMGGYQVTQGFRILGNLSEGVSASEDPKYMTAPGDMTQNQTVENITGVVTGFTKSPNAFFNIVSKLGAAQSAVNEVQNQQENNGSQSSTGKSSSSQTTSSNSTTTTNTTSSSGTVKIPLKAPPSSSTSSDGTELSPWQKAEQGIQQ